MTQLEKDIFEIVKRGEISSMRFKVAEEIASVCKRYIEKAFRENPALKVQEMCGMVTENELLLKFLQENGIEEKKPELEQSITNFNGIHPNGDSIGPVVSDGLIQTQ